MLCRRLQMWPYRESWSCVCAHGIQFNCIRWAATGAIWRATLAFWYAWLGGARDYRVSNLFTWQFHTEVFHPTVCVHVRRSDGIDFQTKRTELCAVGGAGLAAHHAIRFVGCGARIWLLYPGVAVLLSALLPYQNYIFKQYVRKTALLIGIRKANCQNTCQPFPVLHWQFRSTARYLRGNDRINRIAWAVALSLPFRGCPAHVFFARI